MSWTTQPFPFPMLWLRTLSFSNVMGYFTGCQCHFNMLDPKYAPPATDGGLTCCRNDVHAAGRSDRCPPHPHLKKAFLKEDLEEVRGS